MDDVNVAMNLARISFRRFPKGSVRRHQCEKDNVGRCLSHYSHIQSTPFSPWHGINAQTESKVECGIHEVFH